MCAALTQGWERMRMKVYPSTGRGEGLWPHEVGGDGVRVSRQMGWGGMERRKGDELAGGMADGVS